MPQSEASDDSVEVLGHSPERPDRKRLRLRREQHSPPDVVAGSNAVMLQDKPVEQSAAAGTASQCRRKACSGARPSELNRAFGNWWDRRGGAGLEYLSGRAIETFPLLRPLPEVPLAEPPAEVFDSLMKVFEPECVKRMPNGITCNVASCIDAEHAPRASAHKSTAYLCGHIDNFCQKGQEYAQRVYRGRGIPNVRSLQRSIELSWNQGFDIDGAAQLGWRLAGRDTWIGATDAAAFLRFLGFEAVLVEFSSPEAQRARAEALKALESIQNARAQGKREEAAKLETVKKKQLLARVPRLTTLVGAAEIRVKGMSTPPSTSTNSKSKPRSLRPPGPTAAAKKMLPWIYKYFSNAAEDGGTTHNSAHCVVTAAPPLYLQYQGHSTTVIGIERRLRAAGGRVASPSIKARHTQGASMTRVNTAPVRTASQNTPKTASGISMTPLNARLPGQRSLPEVMMAGTGRRRAGPSDAGPSSAGGTPTPTPRAPRLHPAVQRACDNEPVFSTQAAGCLHRSMENAVGVPMAPQNAVDQDRQPLPAQTPHSVMSGALDLTAESDTDDEAGAMRGALLSPTTSQSSIDLPLATCDTEHVASVPDEVELDGRARGAAGLRGRGSGSMTISRSRTGSRQNTNPSHAQESEERSSPHKPGTGGRGRHGAQRGNAGGRHRGGGAAGGKKGQGGPVGVQSAGVSGTGGGNVPCAPIYDASGGVVGGSSTCLPAGAAAAAAAEQRAAQVVENGGPRHAMNSRPAAQQQNNTGAHLGFHPSQAAPSTSHMVPRLDLTGQDELMQARGAQQNALSTQVPIVQHARPCPGAATAGTSAVQACAEAEDDRWEYVLYVLDPQVRFDELRKTLQERQGWQKLLRRTETSLRMPAYQVMAVRGVLPLELREQSKKLTSTRVM